MFLKDDAEFGQNKGFQGRSMRFHLFSLKTIYIGSEDAFLIIVADILVIGFILTYISLFIGAFHFLTGGGILTFLSRAHFGGSWIYGVVHVRLPLFQLLLPTS